MERYQTIVVGGGVAGASSAYHLCNAGVRVLLLESGSHGEGDLHRTLQTQQTRCPEDETQYLCRGAGSKVLSSPNVVKMIVQDYPVSSKEFIRHHGEHGAATYLKLAQEGLSLQKSLARTVLSQPSRYLHELGSIYLAYEEDLTAFQEEYQLLRKCGASVQWLDPQQLKQYPYLSKDFAAGILFPEDAVIDSSAYAKALVAAAQKTSCLTVWEHCADVVGAETKEKGARVTLANGKVFTAENALLCTGGFFLPAELCGILQPCWSYLVAVPVDSSHPNGTYCISLCRV